MRLKVILALILLLGGGNAAFTQLASPFSQSVWPAQTFTAAQTGTIIQLNGLQVSSTVGSSFASGTITLTGTSLTTVTFAVQGSSDNGATFYALPIYTQASPTTAPTTTVTATANGLYQVSLAGLTHVRIVTSGTFTATTVSFVLTASPNAGVAKNGSSSGGGGVTQVSTLPGTCTAGVQYQLPSGYVATCGPSNTFVNNTGTGLDPRQFGADFSGATVADASTTNGSNVITCPNSDCNFPSNVSGYIIFATSGPGNACLDNPSIAFGGVAQTAVTGFTNSNSITVSGTSNTTNTAGVCLAWFPKDSTTALINWWTAGGCRGKYSMPPGITAISAPIMQNLSGCLGSVNQGYAYPGQSVFGSGTGTTFIVPLPSFNYSTIIGQQNVNCAIGNLNIEHMEHLVVWGLGQRATSSLNACLFMDGQATSEFRIDLVGWDARGGGANLTGLNMIGITDTFDVGGVNYFGGVEVVMSGNLQHFLNNYISGNPASINSQCGFLITGSVSVTLIGNPINVCTTVGSGAVLNSVNSQFIGASGDSTALFMNGGKANFDANSFAGAVDFSSTGSTLRARDSFFGGNITGANGNTLEDNCGNTFSGTTTLNGMTSINNCPGEVPPSGPVVTAKTCTNFNGSGSSVTCTWSASPAVGEFVAVGVTAFGTASVMTATDSAGNTYTPVAAIYTPTFVTGVSSRLFYFGPLTASITSITVSATMTGGPGIVVNANSATGIATSSQLDGSQCHGDIAAAGSMSCSAAITTTVADDLIFCNANANDNAVGFTVGSGFTQGSTFNFDNMVQYKVQSAVGAFTPTITNGAGGGAANDATMLCAAFKP